MIETLELKVFDWLHERMFIASDYANEGKLKEVRVYNDFYPQPNGAYIQFKFEIEGNFIAKPFKYDDEGNPVMIKSLENDLYEKNTKSRDFLNISYTYCDERIKANYNWIVAVLNRLNGDLIHEYYSIEDYKIKETWRHLAIQKNHEFYANGKTYGKDTCVNSSIGRKY